MMGAVRRQFRRVGAGQQGGVDLSRGVSQLLIVTALFQLTNLDWSH